MLELELPAPPKLFNRPAIPFSTCNPPVGVRGTIIGKIAERQLHIIPFAAISCQYTKPNFSYKSGLFFQYHFLVKSVLLGDCVVN